MTNESKFKFMYTYSEYDVIRVIVKGINDMYNARNELINNVWRCGNYCNCTYSVFWTCIYGAIFSVLQE